ncbi:hypothetical protein [Ideonella sp. A 288]|nr:hypothetical protein [Ideonella sp. A 288]
MATLYLDLRLRECPVHLMHRALRRIGAVTAVLVLLLVLGCA